MVSARRRTVRAASVLGHRGGQRRRVLTRGVRMGAGAATDDPRVQRCPPAHACAPAFGTASGHAAVRAAAGRRGDQGSAGGTTNGGMARRGRVGRGRVAACDLGRRRSGVCGGVDRRGARERISPSRSRTPRRSTSTWRSNPPRPGCVCHRSGCPALRQRCCVDGSSTLRRLDFSRSRSVCACATCTCGRTHSSARRSRCASS